MSAISILEVARALFLELRSEGLHIPLRACPLGTGVLKGASATFLENRKQGAVAVSSERVTVRSTARAESVDPERLQVDRTRAHGNKIRNELASDSGLRKP